MKGVFIIYIFRYSLLKMNDKDRDRARTMSGQEQQVQIKNVKFYRVEPLDHSKPCMLPTYRHLYQRFLTIKEDMGKDTGAWKTALQMVSSEFIYDWVMMNVYTIKMSNVANKFEKILKQYRPLVNEQPRIGSKRSLLTKLML